MDLIHMRTLFAVVLSLILASTASAKVFQVDAQVDQTDLDVNDGMCVTIGNHCTLRAAVQQANALPGKDTILLPAGIYMLNINTNVSNPIAVRDENAAGEGDLDITDNLEIIGMASPIITGANPQPESQLSIIDGNTTDRVFEIRAAVDVKMSKLIIQNGSLNDTGAGISSFGSSTKNTSLTLSELIVRNNHALNSIGAIGGGIFSSTGTQLTLNKVLVTNNTANRKGGGIYSSEPTTIIDSIISENSAIVGGGAHVTDLVLVNSTIENNHSTGGLPIKVNLGGGLYVEAPNFSYMFNSRITNNTSSGTAGGAYIIGDNVDLNQVHIAGNSADINAGGLFTATSRYLQITDSSIANNTAGEKGGGWYINKGLVNLNNSVIFNNNTENTNGVVTLGGGIYAYTGLLNAINASFSNNKSLGVDSFGGGIFLDWVMSTTQPPSPVVARVNLTHTTMAFNEAASGGNIATRLAELTPALTRATITLSNSILSHSTANTNCSPEIATLTALTSISTSITSDDSCGSALNQLLVAEPLILLTPTTSKRGDVVIHTLPHTTSPALNGAPSGCAHTDLRYLVRNVSGGGCDIGAFEATALANSPGTLQFTPLLGSNAKYSVNELDGSITLKVTREGLNQGDVSVKYRAISASARELLDYSLRENLLNFVDGSDIAEITIRIVPSIRFEPDEIFYVELYAPQGGVQLGAMSRAEITITDNPNDTPDNGRIKFNDTQALVQESQLGIIVKVDRGLSDTLQSDGEVSVDYQLVLDNADPLIKPATNDQDFTLLDGTLTFAHGETQKAFVITLTDDLVYEGDEVLEIILVNPTGGASLSSTDTRYQLTITDDEPKPWSLGFIKDAITVDETKNEITVEAIIEGGELSGAVSIEYTTRDGTAHAGPTQDYALTKGTVDLNLIGGGVANSIPITIPLHDDTTTEGVETFTLELSVTNDTAAVQLEKALATITINDNESPPAYTGELGFSITSFTVDENVGTITIPVVRPPGSSGTASVDYVVTGGNALVDEDFEPFAGTVSFLDGENQKDIILTIVNDEITEDAEFIEISLAQPSTGVVLANFTATVNINASDQPVVVKPNQILFGSVTLTVFEGDGEFIVKVVRKFNEVGMLTAKFDVDQDGSTASINDDYTLTAGTLVFADNVMEQDIHITVVQDDVTEPLETLKLQLINTENDTVMDRMIISINDKPPANNNGGGGNNGGGDDGGGSINLLLLITLSIFWLWRLLYDKRKMRLQRTLYRQSIVSV